MSLLVQMVKDLEDKAKDEKSRSDASRGREYTLMDMEETTLAKKYNELPLFAAADILQKKESNIQLAKRLFLITALLVLFAVVIFVVFKNYFAKATGVYPSTIHSGELYTAATTDLSKQQVEASIAIIEKDDTAVEAPLIDNAKSIAENNVVSHALEEKIIPLKESREYSEKTIVEDENLILVDAIAQKIEVKSALKSESEPLEKTIKNAPIVVKKARVLSVAERDLKTVSEAKSLIASGLADTARQLLSSELDKNKDMLDSASLYISLLVSGRQFAQAEPLILNYRQRFESNTNFVKQHIQFLLATEQYDAAFVLTEKYFVPAYTDVDFLAFQAAIFQAQQKWSDAINAYDTLLTIDSSHARWWLGLAVAQDAMANAVQAKLAYQQVIRIGGLEANLQHYALTRVAQL